MLQTYNATEQTLHSNAVNATMEWVTGVAKHKKNLSKQHVSCIQARCIKKLGEGSCDFLAYFLVKI
jgi:hypothetical protein